MPRAAQLRHLREFFDIVDLTTFRMWAIATDAPTNDLTIELRQMRSDAVLPLKLHRNGAGEWRVVVPNEAELVALRKSLLAVYGASPPTEQSFKRLGSPRDAMRAFLEGMADWSGRGRKLALSTLDLHEIPEALRESDGDLAAGYLCRALHQIGFAGLQSIPNDPLNRDPYVLFEHAEGSIVIAPSGPGPDAPWQFTDGTIRSIAMVYFGTSSLAPALEAPKGIIPSSPYFTLRDFVVERMPALRTRVARFELWQVLALLLTVPSAIFAARFLARTVSRILERATRSMVPLPRWFALALTVMIAVALLLVIPGLLGIPQRAREYSAPLAAAVLNISIAAAAWHVATILCMLLMRVARRSRSTVDDLAVNLLLGSVRAAIIIGCWIAIAYGFSIPAANVLAGIGIGGLGGAIAYGFSIPASNVLAGIGIGGLGVAFASRETIAHFFGAGVLVADRPFRAGDWIQSSLASGVVESVGIRSTRVRASDDSVIVVPNASLASATILNLGKQRPRTLSLQILVMQGATLEKVERFIATLRDRIGANPAFLSGRTTIGVSGIATNGIQIQCAAFLAVDSEQDEAAARHDLLVEVMAVADKEGLGLGPQLAREATALVASPTKS